MLSTILPISVGAVLGALSRHYVAGYITSLFSGGFPWGILICNVVGSFLMGAFIESGVKFFDLTHTVRLFVATGFLGAFTTFSTFSLETILLVNRGQLGLAILYVLASVIISILALYLGLVVLRGF